MRGHRLRDRLDEHRQGRAQPCQRQEILRLGTHPRGAEARGAGQAVPGAVEQEHAGAARGAQVRRREADRLRPGQVRQVVRAQAADRALGRRGGRAAQALMPARASLAWSVAGLIAAVALPWYALQEGLDSGVWLSGLWSSEDYGSGLAEAAMHGKWWLSPVLLALAACLAISLPPMARERRRLLLVAVASAGLALFGVEALSIGLRGWSTGWLNAL